MREKVDRIKSLVGDGLVSTWNILDIVRALASAVGDAEALSQEQELQLGGG